MTKLLGKDIFSYWRNYSIIKDSSADLGFNFKIVQIFVAFSEKLKFNSQNWGFCPYLKMSLF